MNIDEKIIWDFLISKGLNEYGCAGVMGNLYAESALNPYNLQGTFNKKLNMTDEEYTAAVDNGTYTNFVKDSAGYGLAQWTYWTRKQMLLAFAQQANRSIGDLQMQLDFLWSELVLNYPAIVKVLKTATSVREASDIVLHDYEAPPDQSEAVEIKRAGYGQGYYNRFATPAPVEPEQPEQTEEIIPEPEPIEPVVEPEVAPEIELEPVLPEPETDPAPTVEPEQKEDYSWLVKLLVVIGEFLLKIFKR